MRLHDLNPGGSATRRRKRVGRGIGTGHGKTAGRGHKGQLSRSGGGKGPSFEGGQTPLAMRVPKRGFNNVFRKEYAVVKVADLNRFQDGEVVTPEALIEAGLVRRNKAEAVKLLGDGELERKLTVKLHAFSKSAAEKVQAAGGQVEVI